MVKIDNVDVMTKCRSCFSDPPEMHHIFDEFDQGESLSKILKNVTPFEIDENDGLSPYLCENCTTIIINFSNLCMVWQENEKFLRSLLDTEEANDVISIICDDEKNENDDSKNSYPVTKKDKYKDVLSTKYEVEVSGHFVEPQDILVQEFLVDNNVEYIEKANENPGYCCEHCGAIFLSERHLRQHKRSKHDINVTANTGDYSDFPRPKSNRLRNETEPLVCKICKSIFETLFDLKKHYRVHNKHVCEYCGASFLRKSCLNDHFEVHATEKRYVCNVCGKAFRQRTAFLKHKILHTNPRRYICDMCGLRFNDNGTLRTHIKLKHIKERNFQCNICSLKFPLKATLNKHVLRHDEGREKAFSCSICLTAYKDKSSLKRHMEVKHTYNANKPSCKFCHREYTTKANLLKHIRRHHQSIEDANKQVESS